MNRPLVCHVSSLRNERAGAAEPVQYVDDGKHNDGERRAPEDRRDARSYAHRLQEDPQHAGRGRPTQTHQVISLRAGVAPQPGMSQKYPEYENQGYYHQMSGTDVSVIADWGLIQLRSKFLLCAIIHIFIHNYDCEFKNIKNLVKYVRCGHPTVNRIVSPRLTECPCMRDYIV